MAKDKSEKREKKRSEIKEVTETIVAGADIEMEDVEVAKVEKKAKKEKEKVVIPLEDLSPIAHPLAQHKLTKKLHKTIKKASKTRQVKRGVKEIQKGIRKGEKGLLVLAGDITPIDITSHLPVMSEDANLPYVFVTSKEELGHASGTKRPTSCVMICPDMKKAKRKKLEGVAEKADDDGDFKELYDECYREVEKLDRKVIF